VCAVDVGVGHDDDLAVPRAVQVERPPRPGADHLQDRGALGVVQHVGDRGLLNVQDLAADRQQRLVVRRAGQLGGAEGTVPLDDEQLGAADVGAAAVGQLGGQRGGLESVLAALGLLVGAGADPRLHLGDDLVQQQRRLRPIPPLGRAEPRRQLAVHHLGDDGPNRRSAEDLLGLPLELRLGETDRHNGGEPGQCVLLVQLVRAGLEPARGEIDLAAEHLQQSLLEAGQVRAALRRRDDVDEGAHRGLVAGAPEQRDVDAALALDDARGHLPAAVEHRHRLGEVARALQPPYVREGGIGRQEFGELADPPGMEEDLLERSTRVRSVEPAGAGCTSGTAFVAQAQGQTRHEVGRLARPSGQLGIRHDRVLGEDLRVRPEPDPRAGSPTGQPPGDLQLAVVDVRREARLHRRRTTVGEDARLTTAEAHRMRAPTPVHLDVQAGGQRIDDRCAYPVQAARRGVGAAAELPPRVQLGVDHLDAGQPGAGLDVDRDTPAVVADLDRPVVQQQHLDPVTGAGQSLVDAVVDDLPQAVHQPSGVGRADVHAGTLPHSFQALEHLEVPGGVVGCGHGVEAIPGIPCVERGTRGACARPPGRGNTDRPSYGGSGGRSPAGGPGRVTPGDG